MSADEPGYVPPDHETTAEFRIPGRSPAAPPAAEAEATMADRPLPDDLDDPEETATDPVRRAAAPATVTDLTTDDPEDLRALPADDVPEDLPADDVPEDLPADSAPQWLAAAAAPRSLPADDPGDGPEDREDAATGPGEWTEQFGREEEARRSAPTAPHPGLAAASAGPLAAAAVPPVAEPAQPDVPQQSPQPGVPGPTPPPEQAGAQPLPPPGVPQGAPAPDVATPAVGVPAGPVPPPGQPVAFAAPPPAGRERGGSRTLLIAAAAVVLVAAVIGAALALALMPDEEDSGRTTAGPRASAGTGGPGGSGAPTPESSGPGATPAPGGPPQGVEQPPGQGAPPTAPPPTAPIGPVVEGKGLTYRLVQRDPGYYEGLLIITNRGDKPVKEWTLTFRTPGANVKNIWGGELVHGGDRVEIRNLDGAPAIPPGATWEVRFGAEGAPATPKDCRLNDRRCGFT